MGIYKKGPLAELQFIAGHTSHKGPHQWPGRYPSWNLLLTISGHGQVSTPEGVLALKPATLSLLTTPETRIFSIQTAWNVYWAHFHPEDKIERILGWPEPLQGAYQISLDTISLRLSRLAFDELLQVSVAQRPGWRPLSLCLLNSILLRGNLCCPRGVVDTNLDRAKALIEKDDSGLSIEAIAHRCGYSRSSFYTKFRAAYGVSPRTFRETLQLRKSLALLEEGGLSMEAIANHIGMGNAFYFSSRFKKQYGVSPSTYRTSRKREG